MSSIEKSIPQEGRVRIIKEGENAERDDFRLVSYSILHISATGPIS